MGWWVKQLTNGHWAAVVARLAEIPRAERRRRITRAQSDGLRDRRVWVPLVISLAACSLPTVVASYLPRSRPTLAVAAMLGALAVVCAAWTWVLLMQHRLTRRHLAAEFPTLCPTCGYDRRATPARCPECGTASPAAPSSRRIRHRSDRRACGRKGTGRALEVSYGPMTKPPALNYEVPSEATARLPAALFWSVYLSCVVVGDTLLQPMLANLLWGRPGDQGVAAFVLLSSAAVTILWGLTWRLIPRTWSNITLALASTSGLGSFLPGYAAMYLLFG